MDSELLSLIMFGGTILALLLGFPVAMTLGGSALIFAYIGDGFGLFNSGMLNVFPLRILGIMKNEPLIAVPLFVFMGVMLRLEQFLPKKNVYIVSYSKVYFNN